MRRLWKSTGRRWRGEPRSRSREPLRIDAPLPPDAVVIPQRSLNSKGTPYVLTVVSEHEKCVVKIFAKERKTLFDNELSALRLAQAAGVGHRVPELISSGQSVNGFCWLVSRLVRNSGLFYPPTVGDWLWRRYLLKQILPDLQRFYEQSGIDVLTGSEWLDRVRGQVAEHPMSARLRKLADLVEAARRGAGDDRIPFAVVHGDLRPHNVHRHAGKWWLIDWSMSRRAPLMVDLWTRPLNALASEIFGAWLRGHTRINVLPQTLRAPLDMYAEWQASWLGIKLDADALRFQALATLLHRLSRNRVSGRSPLSIVTFRAVGIEN